MGRPRFDAARIRSKNDKRSSIRKGSQLSENVTKSLQTCRLNENETVLNEFIARHELSQNETIKKLCHNLRGLRAVLQVLLSQFDNNQGLLCRTSYMSFNDAINHSDLYEN